MLQSTSSSLIMEAFTIQCNHNKVICPQQLRYTSVINLSYLDNDSCETALFGKVRISGRWQAPAAHILSSVHYMLALDLI